MVRLADLEAFVVRAKTATYVGSGAPAESSRLGSHDLTFASDEWLYRDSYFGGTDFLGQETVWLRGEPVWAENYYGYILRPDLIDATQAGATIKAALSAMFRRGGSWVDSIRPAHTGAIKINLWGTSHASTGVRSFWFPVSRRTRWTTAAA